MNLKRSLTEKYTYKKDKISIILSFICFIFIISCNNSHIANLKQNILNKSTYGYNNSKIVKSYFKEIKNIFFHTLVVYPEKAFDGDRYTNYLDTWFITVNEFQKVLNNLYDDGYILVDLKSMYSITEKNGKYIIGKKRMKLPPGKKPLIISIDDVNYYHYTRMNGLVHKLVLDKNNDIASLSVDKEGRTHIRKNEDIIPIMEEFIKKHPDFSFKGARGIIALTGYMGIMGYDTHRRKHAHEFAVEKAQAVKVARHLKKLGWIFASHSYTHIHSKTCTYREFKRDADRWDKEVRSLVGDVDIFIYPYGEEASKNSRKVKYLKKKGFHIFMGVESKSDVVVYNNSIFIKRIPIDGHFLRGRYGSQTSVFSKTESIAADSTRKKF